MEKSGNTKGASIKSGLSEHSKFKGGPEHVSGFSGKNQVPKKPMKKISKFKIG